MKRTSLIILQGIFYLVLICRFVFPFIHNPINNLFSDPYRHWINGMTLLKPQLFNAIDPKVYQIYTYMLVQISGEGSNKLIIALCTGILCSLFAFFWFMFCKEIFPRKHAYIVSIIIGILPAFIGIYAYFMIETMFLDLLALSLWLSFRALRKDKLRYYVYAYISLFLLLNTKLMAAPVFFILTLFMLLKLKQKIRFLLITSSISLFLMTLSGIYNYSIMKVYAPIYFSKMNHIYYLSDYKAFSFNTNKYGSFEFSSPSYFTKITEPLFTYRSPRKEGSYLFNIDLNKGNEDWDREIEKLSADVTLEKTIDKKMETLVYMLFGPEWPESSGAPNVPLYQKISFHSRWMWFPLICIVIYFAPFQRYSRNHAIIICVTYAMLILFIAQTSAIFEGRYRKPAEALIVTSVYIIIFNRKLRKDIEAKDTIS